MGATFRGTMHAWKVDITVERECLAGIHQLVDGIATTGTVGGVAGFTLLLALHHVVQPLGSGIGHLTADGGGALLLHGLGLVLRRVALAVALRAIDGGLSLVGLLHEVVGRAEDDHLCPHRIQVVIGGPGARNSLYVRNAGLRTPNHLRTAGGSRSILLAEVELLLILLLLHLCKLGGIQHGEVEQLLSRRALDGQIAAVERQAHDGVEFLTGHVGTIGEH